MEQVTVNRLRIAQVESDRLFDTITFEITATAVDYVATLDTDEYVRGSRSPETFIEYWSFIRRPGAKSLAGKGLIEGNCPNCGALLHLNETAVCDACKALVRSGEYDWVLAEITQACEWRVRTAGEIPGLAGLAEDDPGFSVQHLEDRVSVMYWRLMAAWRAGRVDPVRKMATDAFCEDFARLCAPGRDGVRSWPGDCAVGAVNTLGVVREEPLDTALVEVRWSAGRMERDATGAVRETAASSVKIDVFLVTRRHGVKTDLSQALSSAHCPGCGAPAGAGLAAACEYCGLVLNSGEHDWVLAARKTPFDRDVTALRRRLAREAGTDTASAGGPPAVSESGRGPLEMLAWMALAMTADEVVDEKELEVIRAYGRKHGIPAAKIESTILAAREGRLDAPRPRNAEEVRAWLEQMAVMALADGFVSAPEKAAMMRLGRLLGWSAYDVRRIIVTTRRELYRRTKQDLRELRRRK
jgi:hypothetical protein